METRHPLDSPYPAALQDFEATYRRLAPGVARFMSSQLHPSDVDDAVAGTFVTAWRRRSASPEEPDHYRSWLYGIARYEALNHRRARRRRQGLVDQTLSRASMEDHLHIDLRDVDADVAPGVVAALADLRPADRELLVLVALWGFSLREAASELGVNHGAARMRMVRLRSQAQAFLRELEGIPDGADI